MRLLLLSCRSPFVDDSKVYPPLANLYLKSAVNAMCPEVDVRLGDDAYELGDLSPLAPFDVIGISVMTPQRQEALQLAQAVKARWPDKRIVAGGPHVMHYLGDLLAEPAFDYLVPHDGERALAAIVGARGPLPRVLSDKLSRAELAAQPRPDRTSEEAVTLIRQYHYMLGGRRATTMLTARGCPEQCTFCEDATTLTRPSTIDTIREELNDIVRLGYSGVYIFDDLFALSLARIRPICDELQRRALIYRCNAQARCFTKHGDEMARALADTGCYEIAFGAESGSQQILDVTRKRCTVEQNYLTVAFAKRHGLKVKAFILLGLPGENRQSLAETEAFIRDSGIDDFQCAIYMPYKGTAIRRAIDANDPDDPIDLMVVPRGYDGEVTGSYGIKGGATSSEVRTAALSENDLQAFRNYLVDTYRPHSHRMRWAADHFFDAHLSDRPDGGPTTT